MAKPRREVETAPETIRVVRDLLIHGPNTSGRPCWCCGSPHAEVVTRRKHMDVLIDGVTTRRTHRDVVGDEAFERAATGVRTIEIHARATWKTWRAIVDRKHKIIGLFGGARSTKTSALAEIAVSIWLRSGGRGSQIWWVAPHREKTQVGVGKLVVGTPTAPPCLPAEVVLSYPEHDRIADQSIRLIDGTAIVLALASREGDNLKGVSAIAVLFDEGGEVESEKNWQVALDRTTDTAGPVVVATTPTEGHWLERHVVAPGVDYDEAERRELDGEVIDVITLSLGQRDNPWLSVVEIDRRIRAGGGLTDPLVRQEVLGEWIGTGTRAYRYVAAKHSPRWQRAEDLGMLDITRLVALDHFDSPVRWILGLDVNLDPLCAVLAQVWATHPRDYHHAPDRLVLAVRHEYVLRHADVSDLADQLARDRPEGVACYCDPSGAWANPPAGHIPPDSDSASPAAWLESAGVPTQPCHWRNGRPVHPSQRDSIALVNDLLRASVQTSHGAVPSLIVHPDCDYTIRSLASMKVTPKGGIAKQSNTAADRLSGASDAVRYLAWGLRHEHWQERAA